MPAFLHQAPQQWKTPTTRLLVGARLRVFWQSDQGWHPGTVTARSLTSSEHTVLYDGGESEALDLSAERFEVLPLDSSGTTTPLWASNIEQYWLARLGDSTRTRTLIAVMQSSLSDKTRGNYHPKVLEYLEICHSALPEPLCPAPATEDTVLHYLTALGDKGTIQAHCMGVYMSAVNKFHTEQGFDPPALGPTCRSFLRGLGRRQKAARDASGSMTHIRVPLPTYCVTEALDAAVSMTASSSSFTLAQQELYRSLVFVVLNFVLFCRGETGVTLRPDHVMLTPTGIHVVPSQEKGRGHVAAGRLVTIPRVGMPDLWQLLSDYKAWYSSLDFGSSKRACKASIWRLPHEMRGRWPSSLADTWLQVVMKHLGHSPPAGLAWSGHSMRKGSSSAAKSIGVFLESICYFADWSILAGTYHTYIDPTWMPTAHCRRLFAWMKKS